MRTLRIATALALVGVSSATGIVFFGYMVLHHGEGRFYEHIGAVLWFEFLLCLGLAVLGFVAYVAELLQKEDKK